MRIVEAPLTKITLNLFTADVEYLRKKFPIGYTEVIRDEVRTFVYALKSEDMQHERNRPFDGEMG
jgi:hypothetical protein